MEATAGGSATGHWTDQSHRDSALAAIRAKTQYLKDYMRMADMRCGKNVHSEGQNLRKPTGQLLREAVDAALPGDCEMVFLWSSCEDRAAV